MTSIDYLVNELWEHMNMQGDGKIVNEIYEQAKEIHKQEIMKSRENGISEGYRRTNNFYYDKMVDSEQYYQKTFVSKDVREDALQFLVTQSQDLELGYESELPKQETLYTEDQVREVVKMAQTRKYNSHFYNADEIIQSLKQPKKD
jgi:hypothetical protein